jgi:shikimate dehydrogenase
MINKDTQFCISVASRPSNFGTTLHNAAYAALGLNFAYKAFGIADIAGAITGVKALGIRGCSVSMPFKVTVMKYLTSLDQTAREIGAVNTVVNDNGHLTGYNTDAHGAKAALETLGIGKDERVLLLGAGGAARAILYALQQLQVRCVLVANRDLQKGLKLAEHMGSEAIEWSSRNEARVDVLINATPVGMEPHIAEMPVNEGVVYGCRAVMDVVVSPAETRLIKEANKLGKQVALGHEMSLHQAAAQFRLYTGVDPPLDVMRASMARLLQSV